MNVWRAGRIAIDANYVSSGINVGMVWGLFAATPAIARIRSRTYQESVWCRRELELTDYLLRKNDFLTKRWIIDLEESDLGRLEPIVKAWNPAVLIGPPSSLPEFPPVIEVCSPSLMPVWRSDAARERRVALDPRQ